MKTKTTRKINYIFIFFIVCVLPLLTYLTKLVVGTTMSPDTLFFYSPSDLVDLAQVYGPGGGLFYMFTRLTFDLVWPVVYFSFLLSHLKNLGLSKKLFQIFKVSLLIAVFADLSENLFCSIVLMSGATEENIITLIAAIASSIKWISLLMTVFGLLLFKLKGILNDGTVS